MNITNEQFDAKLFAMAEEMSAKQIIMIPGVYEIVAEFMNDDVCDACERDNAAAMQEQIERIAQSAIDGGQEIEIDDYLPSISIKTGIEEYYFQEHEAQALIDEAQKIADDYNVSLEDALLYQAQSW